MLSSQESRDFSHERFKIIEESPLQDEFKSFSVAPNKNSETSISLIEKEFMKKYSLM